MHGKEEVLAPKLEKAFGVTCVVLQMDTDLFGTFSGEVARTRSVLETARNKCDYANVNFDCNLVLSSEGTFGPHPTAPFVPSDHEFLLLRDYTNDLEISGAVLEFTTNYRYNEIYSLNELLDFAMHVGFPSHGLILRSVLEPSSIYKGIIQEDYLIACFNSILERDQKAWVETDMRAIFNPTRMNVISQAADVLISNVNSLCPSCNCPGFSVIRSETGLPCVHCGLPTCSILKEVLQCQRCRFNTEVMYPYNKKAEEPMYCNTCNP
jgi:hypothetical protein